MTAPELEFLKNEAGEEEGLSDAGIETFRDDPYASCAREAGQNSRDAGLNNGAPVRMTFDLILGDRDDLPFYESLAGALDCCRSQAHAEKEKEFFKNACAVISKATLPILRISDFNTKGLVGPPEKSGTVFHSLLKSSGVSKKDSETSGGSYGIGKNANFAVSDLQTVMYSTVYAGESGEHAFAAQGKVKLVSHEDESGVHRRSTGYWGFPDGFRAITTDSVVPEWMRRSEIGTSIFCVGFRQSEGWAERMTYSLVSNFFVAIQNEDMEFEVDSGRIKINSNTLEGLLSRQDIEDTAEKSGHSSELEFACQLHRCLVSEAAAEEIIDIPGLGKIKVRILAEVGMPRRVGFVRNGMLITDNLKNFGHSFTRFNGADFIALVQPCDDAAGKVLKRLENPAHNAFSAERISDPTGRRVAEKAMRSLGNKLREMIKAFTSAPAEDSLALDELGKYFAYRGKSDSAPDPTSESDPETYTYSAARVPVRKTGGSGRNGNEGGQTGGHKGRSSAKPGGGSSNQPGTRGAGDAGASDKRTSVDLSDVRNRIILDNLGTAKARTLYFSSPVTGLIELALQATGVNTPESLYPVKAGGASIKNDKILLDVKEGERNSLLVEFDEPYDGPIEVNANKVGSGEVAE
ncbi:hypothetical protein [Pseudomonas silesiensis]|uniref:hypothetical protein n=1 Tax=Pseudomonas silesiensis TaxID=1853130 RepID=UPI0030D97B21